MKKPLDKSTICGTKKRVLYRILCLLTILLVVSGCGIRFIQCEKDCIVLPIRYVELPSPPAPDGAVKNVWTSVPIIQPLLESIFKGVANLNKFSSINKALEPANNKILLLRKRTQIGLFITGETVERKEQNFWKLIELSDYK